VSKVVHWLQNRDNRIFFWVNQRIQHSVLDAFFSRITHLGGASATILFSLCFSLFGQGSLKIAGLQSLVALIVSHIPVAILKKKYPRLRPYLIFPQTKIGKNPLTDHSFPSGHTTAIFSIVLPFMMTMPLLTFALLPLALMVGISRMYIGLHYPSDVLAGSLVGTLSAIATVVFWV
jgi:undecaprenyl-diphosphatase